MQEGAFRWGIAGFGWVARDHMAPGLAQAGGVLAAVADPSPIARSAAERLGARAYADIDALLAAGGIDALYVATPNHLHLPPVAAAARAGVPVLCEKPLAADLEDAEAIGRAVEAGGGLSGVAFDQRRHPAHRAAAEAIAQGRIGRVAAVRIAYCCWVDPLWRPPGDEGTANWRADPKAAGGGAVVDLAPHGLDLVHALLGEEAEGLHMRLQRRVHDYPVEDGGLVTGITGSGVLLDLHVAYNCPEALPRRRLEILGSEGQITATDTMGQTAGGELVWTCGRTGAREPIAFDGATSPFVLQARAFAEAVGGAPHDYSLGRDLRLHRRFDRAYREALACL